MHKKSTFVLNLIGAVAVALMLGVIPAQSLPGSGTFEAIDVNVNQVIELGDSTIIKQTLSSMAVGTMQGPATGDFVCVVKTVNQKGYCSGSIGLTGQVDDASGKMEIYVVFEVDGTTLKEGTFAINSGIAGLSCLHGYGTMEGTFETGGEYDMEYEFGSCTE